MSGYADWVQEVTIRAQQASSDESYSLTNNADFNNSLPRFINYGEGRCYRELIPLAARTQTAGGTFTAGSRYIPCQDQGVKILVVEGLSLITPVNTAPANGTRQRFDGPVSLDFIDNIWPVEATTIDPTLAAGAAGSSPFLASSGVIGYWGMYDDQTIVFGPSVNAAYTAEITGLFQPTALSSDFPDTYLTLNYFSWFLAATMIDIAIWMRDNAPGGATPMMLEQYEKSYAQQRESVIVQEQMRRGQGVGWTAFSPTPLATPPRT